MLFFFFFFQAEDGIRDYKVTGVQTCALPISARAGVPELCDGNERCNENHDAAGDRVWPPLARSGADWRSPGLRLRSARRRAAAFLAHRASLLAARSIRSEASGRSRTRPRSVRSRAANDR